MRSAIALAIILVVALPAAHADDSSWSRGFAPYGVGWQNTAGTVNAVGYRNGNLYIAGLFDRVGVVPANNIARYDGYQWHALDEGTNGEIYDMEVLELAVYVCGNFDEAGGGPAAGLARWHESNWYNLGDGEPNGGVYCLEWSNGDLYAGGNFTWIGDVETGRVGKWNSVEWARAGANSLTFYGFDYGTVRCLEEFGGEIWAGGDFDFAHPWDTPYLAYLDEGLWYPPGTGVGFDERVEHLRSYGSTLWVMGRFDTVEGQSSPRLAKADLGHGLLPFSGTPPAGEVRDIIPDDFSFVLATDRTVRLHTLVGWSSPYDTLANVRVLDEIAQEIVAGGHFLEGTARGDAVVRWDGDGWRHIGGGLARSLEAPDYISGFTTLDGDLVAGGYFNLESVSPEVPHCYNVGRYDGKHWLPLGRGFTGEVNDVIVFQGQLFAGGAFETSGFDPTGHLALWIDDTWQPVGGGASIDGEVFDLIVHDGLLVAGGSFDSAGGVSCEDLVSWDGLNFAPLGLGQMDGGTITAMTSHAGDLYVAGYFSAIDGVAANRIARWDGSGWHAVGAGLDGQTMALASYGGQLWAGRRHYAPGEDVVVLSRWDGDAWHDAATAVGSDPFTEIDALLSGSAGLVAGGSFHTIGGVAAGNAAVWTGSAWEPFGSGVSGGYWSTGVRALHVHEDHLYLGGDFTHAGGYASASIARWNETMTPVFLQRFTAVAVTDGPAPVVQLAWQVTVDGAPPEFRLVAVGAGSARRELTCRAGDDDGRWFAADRAAALARGGEVSYLLSVRQGDADWTEIGRETVTMPAMAAWSRPSLAVAPNPANPQTVIALWLPRGGETTLAVYDLRGREVVRLLTGVQPAGRVEVAWDGRDGTGREAASGVYLVQARCVEGMTTERVALVR